MRNIQNYTDIYNSTYLFEKVLVKFRRQLIYDRLAVIQPSVVIEIGVGSELMAKNFRGIDNIKKWISVEPSDEFYSSAIMAKIPNFEIYHGTFEDKYKQIKKSLNQAPDYIICSGLLHEVSDSSALIQALRNFMNDMNECILHVSVPNADSFHRRLAKSMGIIDEVNSLSQRNILLQQNRVYDLNQLSHEFNEFGFEIVNHGGYFLKPFTHEQMQDLPFLDDKILNGLNLMGIEHPDLASEIFIEVKLKK